MTNDYNDMNNRYTNNRIVDLKRTSNGNRAYSTNVNNSNYYVHNEIVPRIVRNKKSVNKFDKSFKIINRKKKYSKFFF